MKSADNASYTNFWLKKGNFGRFFLKSAPTLRLD